MKTLKGYLDDAKKVTGSDYKTAKALGITRQHLSAWRRGKPISDDMAVTLADLLRVSPFEILANQNAERAKDNGIRKKWEKLARSVTAALLVVVGLASPAPDATAAELSADQLNNNRYYANLRRILRFVLDCLGITTLRLA